MAAKREQAIAEVRQRVKDGLTWDQVRTLLVEPEDKGVMQEGEEFEGVLDDGEKVYEVGEDQPEAEEAGEEEEESQVGS